MKLAISWSRMYFFGDVGIVGDGLLVDTVLVLGSQLHLADDLVELLSGDLADGAALGSGLALMNVTTNGANKLLHKNFLLTVILNYFCIQF